MRIKILCIAFLLCWVSPAEAQTKIVLNTSSEPPNSTENLDGIADRVMVEAFQRLGVEMEIARLPSARAVTNANEGVGDGIYVRVGGLITTIYPNLIQVPVPISQFEFVAFSTKYDFQPKNWESLSPFHVGIVHGWKILEENIKETKSLTTVSSPEALFKMLEAERLEVVVYDLNQGQYFIKELGIKNIKVMVPSFTTRDMYLYLHKKHQSLIPNLTEILLQMKRDGSYQEIVSDSLKELE